MNKNNQKQARKEQERATQIQNAITLLMICHTFPEGNGFYEGDWYHYFKETARATFLFKYGPKGEIIPLADTTGLSFENYEELEKYKKYHLNRGLKENHNEIGDWLSPIED